LSDTSVSFLLGACFGLVAAYLVWYLTFSFPILWIYRGALARGDYQKALSQIAALRRRLPKYLSFTVAHGFILLIAGRAEEAEPLWHEILAEVQNGALALQATCLVNLAEVLDQQGRFAEATPLLVTALEMVPERGLFYRELASHYQVQHVNEDQTLRLSDSMMRFSRRPYINLSLNRYSWEMTLAIRALALANAQRYDEAEAVLEKAFKQGDRHFKPGMAALYCHRAEINLLQ
jgi:ATP/maltotriose-dependent transcriptional regulator MalT